MKTNSANFKTIDEYIELQAPEIRLILSKIRDTIQQAAPEATEAISYQMPTFKLNGNLVHFAAYANHIGFYPAPSGINAFEKELPPTKPLKALCNFLLINRSLTGLLKRL